MKIKLILSTIFMFFLLTNISVTAQCTTSSVTAGNYFLNNNDWGSFRDGFNYQCVWYNNINSWGTYATHTGSVSSGIKGYPSMVYGTQGNVATTSNLPKPINNLGDVRSWWSWTADGDSWNAAYDIWFNDTEHELMLWMQWENAWPIGNSLGPVATNVSLAGHTWDVYREGKIYSFLLVNQQGWISLNIKPIINYCVNQGWIPSSAQLWRIEAGWEIINGGDFKTKSFGISRI